MFYLGHVDSGEDIFTTAQRETEEEAGLKPSHYKVLDGFKEMLAYQVKGKPKEVHYWLAELTDPNTKVILSDEHIRYSWADLTQAKLLSKQEQMSVCLDKAEQFIRNSK